MLPRRYVSAYGPHRITQKKGAIAMTDIQRVSLPWLSSYRLRRALGGSATQKACRRVLAVLGVLLLFCPLASQGQELAATLSGTVTDTSGAVIPRATITIALNGVNGTSRVVQSDGNGTYVATNLPAGTSSMTAVAGGFETYKANQIVLNVADKHTVNIQLKAGSVDQTVVVEDNPVSVDTESSAQAGTISGVQVRELELSSRNFEQLVTLQPGVVNELGDEASAGSSAISVNGARTTANNWTVDGADVNDSGSNG